MRFTNFGIWRHTRSVISVANSMKKWNILAVVDFNFNGTNELINMCMLKF